MNVKHVSSLVESKPNDRILGTEEKSVCVAKLELFLKQVFFYYSHHFYDFSLLQFYWMIKLSE